MAKSKKIDKVAQNSNNQPVVQNAEELDRRLTAVKIKIEELLKENNAALVPVTIISNDKVLSRIDIVPATKS